jgi:acetylornithine deacetylase/succinyl-diaminopimelate desuccinylase-like protein
MIASLQSYLEQHQQSFLRDLAALVDVDCGTYNKPGVDAAGAVMAKLLHDTGFVVERIPLARYGDCLVGRITGRGRARVLLVGHLDTVYSDGTVAERPFRIEGDKAIGPGTCDMKGGLLAGVYAVRALRAAGYDDFVAGGTRPNVVPDAAMAEFDFRVVRAEDYAALEAAVREIMATRHIDGTTTVLEGDLGMPPMELTPATAQLADTARMVAQELGFDIADIATGGASDANHISALGVPVLDGLGPIGHAAHSPDEYLSVASIVPRTALLAGLIAALGDARRD